MNLTKEQWEAARSQMGNMDSNTLLSQARMLRNMDKNTVRMMQPQFAQMSDSQIDGYLAQMEMMAQNPELMRLAQQQMSSMSHEDVSAQMAAATRAQAPPPPFEKGDRVKLHSLAKAAEHNGKLGTVVGQQGERFKVQLDADSKTLALKEANLEKMSSPVDPGVNRAVAPAVQQPTIDAQQLREAQRHMQDPDGIRQQAQMLRSMDPDVVRRTNPAMAGFSDAQIKAAADQMEMMASNPTLLDMASKQMANMSPEQIEAMQDMMRGGAMPPVPPAPRSTAQAAENSQPSPPNAPDMSSAAKMLESMDSSQLESMLDIVKQNPDMVKNILKSNSMMAGVSPELIDKQMEMLDKLPPEQLKRMIGWATKAHKVLAPVASAYAKANNLVGGRLKSILLAGLVALLAAFVMRFFGIFRYSGGDPASEVMPASPLGVESVVADVVQAGASALTYEDDEFEDFGS